MSEGRWGARFLQTDPIGYGDGPNIYAYVHGDPINMADPSGHGCPEDPDCIAGVEVGGGHRNLDYSMGEDPWERQQGGFVHVEYTEDGTPYQCDLICVRPGAVEKVVTFMTSRGVIYSTKIANQMAKRGWSPELIDEALETGNRIDAINMATKGAATRYISPSTGQSVVVDNATNEVIQVGGPGFKFGDYDVPGAQMRTYTGELVLPEPPPTVTMPELPPIEELPIIEDPIIPL